MLPASCLYIIRVDAVQKNYLFTYLAFEFDDKKVLYVYFSLPNYGSKEKQFKCLCQKSAIMVFEYDSEYYFIFKIKI